MKDYNYRFITIEDVTYRDIVKLRYEVFFKDFNFTEEVVFDELEKDAIHLACYIGEGEIIGYGRLNVKEDIARISQLVIKDGFRRGGIASNIMNLLYEEAKERGGKEVFLNARVEALEFYKKLGYVIRGDEFLSSKTRIPHMKMVKSSER